LVKLFLLGSEEQAAAKANTEVLPLAWFRVRMTASAGAETDPLGDGKQKVGYSGRRYVCDF
jgi:hypothetical protein